MKGGLRVTIYDSTQRGWPWLSLWWAIGSRLFSASDVVIAASSWAEAYDRLAEIDEPIELLSVWGHGDDGSPLIAGRVVSLAQLSQALRTITPTTQVWWRSCEVARGARGADFMRAAVAALKCSVVAHCVVVAAPNPLVQGAICGLHPGESVWWPPDGRGLPGCSTLRMTPPPWAYTGVR